MKLRTPKELLAVVKARGMKVRVDYGPPPMPVLVRPANVPKAEASEILVMALKAWRLEIIEELSKYREPGAEG